MRTRWIIFCVFCSRLICGFPFWVWFIFYFACIMGPIVAPQQQQRNVSCLHPFYEFLDDLPKEMSNNLTNRLGSLYNREFVISPTIDWDKLNEIGILGRLNPYFTNTFFDSGASFTCNRWRNLFSIKDAVFRNCVWNFSQQFLLK